MSVRESVFRSPSATAEGVEPTLTVEGGVKPPAPFPSRIEIVPAVEFATTRSGVAPRLICPAAIAFGPAPTAIDTVGWKPTAAPAAGASSAATAASAATTTDTRASATATPSLQQ